MYLEPATVPSQSPEIASPAAYVASLIINATGGVLYGLHAHNSNGAARWIQLFDSATLPADTAVPLLIYSVATLTSVQLDFGVFGLRFTKGIVVCNSSTGPTKTIGAADSWFCARFKSA